MLSGRNSNCSFIFINKMSTIQDNNDNSKTVIELNKENLDNYDNSATIKLEDVIIKEKAEKVGATRLKINTETEELEENSEENIKNETFTIQIDEGGVDVVDARVMQKQSNTYAAKKTVAQGMMDIALITANANQLRYILEYTRNSSTFYLVLCLIVISLFLQIGVGICLIFKGRLDLRGKSKDRDAKLMNNYVVVGVFMVTIINVFVASFTTTGSPQNGS